MALLWEMVSRCCMSTNRRLGVLLTCLEQLYRTSRSSPRSSDCKAYCWRRFCMGLRLRSHCSSSLQRLTRRQMLRQQQQSMHLMPSSSASKLS